MSIFPLRSRRRHLKHAIAVFEREQCAFTEREMATVDALFADITPVVLGGVVGVTQPTRAESITHRTQGLNHARVFFAQLGA